MTFRFTILAVLLATLSASAQARDPLAGAWEQIAARNLTTGQQTPITPAPLRVVYADGFYVQFAAAAKRPVSDTPREKMTRDELVVRSNMQGQYGTYRVAGNRVTRRVISAANPANEGRETTTEFRIEGDVLVTTGTNLQGQTVENRFRRLRQTT